MAIGQGLPQADDIRGPVGRFSFEASSILGFEIERDLRAKSNGGTGCSKGATITWWGVLPSKGGWPNSRKSFCFFVQRP